MRVRSLNGTLYVVSSGTTTTLSYLVDARVETCSCKDFTYRKSTAPRGSQERLCKHLRALQHWKEESPSRREAPVAPPLGGSDGAA